MEAGDDVVVGLNRFTTTEPSPLQDGVRAIETIDPAVEADAVAAIRAWRAGRDPEAVEAALDELRAAAKTDANLMEASVACAKAGVTTGEWTGALREVFGRVPGPDRGGSGRARRAPRRRPRSPRCASASGRRGSSWASGCGCSWASPGSTGTPTAPSRWPCAPATSASRSSTRASGSTPAQIVAAAVQEGVHVVGLSVLSGSHLEVVPAVVEGLRAAGVDDVPVVVGGIIPPDDEAVLRQRGVAAVFTPKDYRMTDMMDEIVTLVRRAQGLDGARRAG